MDNIQDFAVTRENISKKIHVKIKQYQSKHSTEKVLLILLDPFSYKALEHESIGVIEFSNNDVFRFEGHRIQCIESYEEIIIAQSYYNYDILTDVLDTQGFN